MASNIAPDEDEPMHQAGLDMTRGSLRDILDRNDVNVSTALPTVPQDTTNPFINPNQTLADIIPYRNLGPLASLKITDADLIIRNLNSQLNAAVEKNDQSTALLRRMDQRQKEIEAELAALKAEKDAAIQEKRDHTINQERLAENIRDNLEKEYADKEQNYVRQLKQELRAKTSTIRDQCKMEFDQELKKLKEEWNQECLKTNEQHNVQISQVLKEIDALKEHSRTQQKAEVIEPGDKISDLKTTAFDFVPSTVNTKRGGAVISTRKQSCGAKMKMLHQYHHVNMSILQVHLVIQCSPISLTQMMITQQLVIQEIHSLVILAIHSLSNKYVVIFQYRPRSTQMQQLSSAILCPLSRLNSKK